MAIIPDFNPAGGNYRPQAPSLGAAMAPGKAMQQFGQDIAGAAELGAETAQRIQKSRDLDAMNQAREAMQTALAGHQEFRAGDPDGENGWEADITKRIADAKAEVMQRPNLSGDAKARLNEQFSSWTSEYGTKARTDALNYGQAKARTRVTRLSKLYREKGDYDSSRRVVQEAMGVSLSNSEGEMDLMDIDAEEADAKKREVVTNYERGALDDPIRVIESLDAKNEAGAYLNDPDMDHGARVRLMKTAERSLDQHQREEFDTLKQGIDEGKISAEEIHRLPLFLDDGQKRALSDYYQRKQPPTDQEEGEAWKRIISIRDDYNAAKAGSMDEIAYRKAHRDARTEILKMVPSGYNGPLLETLQRYSPARLFDMKQPTPPTLHDVKSDIRVEIASTMGAAQDSGFFGKIDEETPPMEKEKVSRKRRDLERKVWDFVDRLKDPTPEAAREYADKLLGGERVKSTANDLRQFVPGSGQRFRTAPAMPALPPKQGAKDNAVSDPLQLPPGNGTASADLLPARQLENFLNSPQP